MKALLLISMLICSPLWAQTIKTECLGPHKAKGFVIYLHGLENENGWSREEVENRRTLERLAKDLELRIALPQAPLCRQKQRCWSASDERETLTSFHRIQKATESCWTEKKPYTMIGFSNGGYFAFKLYKIHQDPLLRQIIASGSSGRWDQHKDRPHPHSQLSLLIGTQDMTHKDASQLASSLRTIPHFSFHSFAGGHRLDYDSLVKILNQTKN